MIWPLFVDYATPSVLESRRDEALLGLVASRTRPVRFHGRVAPAARMPLRFALQTLGEVIGSAEGFTPIDAGALDPIVTVHPGRLLFEGLSADLGAYGLVMVDRRAFATEGEVVSGTTNVDFTAWLYAALGELRSSRETWLRIDPAGFELSTVGFGGRHQETIDVPTTWVRGLLAIAGAMSLPGTRLSVAPVHLLAAIRFLASTKAKLSPRALRYELVPGEDARLILEPWEHVVVLAGAEHGYAERRVIRTWGRGRLRRIERLLAYAERVTVYLKGRGLPSFYLLELPGGVRFLLGISGSERGFARGAGLGALFDRPPEDGALARAALAHLRARFELAPDDLARIEGASTPDAGRALAGLVRRGQALYDLEARAFLSRELFDRPPPDDELFPADPEVELGERLASAGELELRSVTPRETRKIRRLRSPGGPVHREVVYREWAVSGRAGDQPEVEVVVHEEGRVVFGRCGCRTFREHVLARGPCGHMIALLRASEGARGDLPTSTPAEPPPADEAEG